jgi:hypothetical protein
MVTSFALKVNNKAMTLTKEYPIKTMLVKVFLFAGI